MEITIEEIQSKFESLPENLKWAIMAARVDENIIEIGKVNGLNVDQVGQLSLETNMVILGFVPTEKFKDSLKGSMDLPEEKINALVNAINEKILKGIREYLMSMSEEKETEETDLSVQEKENETINIPVKSISSQDLSNPFQVPIKKTDYTLGSLPKDGTAPTSSIAPSPVSSFATPVTPPVTPSIESKPTTDPYREIPE